MKKKLLLSIALVATTLFTSITYAQKYGHVDAQELLFEMPEVVAAQAELERYRSGKESELKDMYERYQRSAQQLQTDLPNLTTEIANSRRNELMEKEQIITQFQQNAEQKLQQKEQELFTAPTDKLKAVIKKVAEDNNYTYIFDASVLLYQNGDDISELIKTELAKKANPAPVKAK